MALELIKSDNTIKALKPGEKTRLKDGGGLYLLPYFKGGAHAWRFDYTFEGKRKTLSLGVYPAVGLAKARDKAKDFRKSVADGINPSDERKQLREQIAISLEVERRVQAGEPPIGSFEEFARRWYGVRKSDWSDTYSPKVIRRLELHAFPFIGQRMLKDITPAVVLEVCRRVESQGAIETAHRVRELCSNVFQFAITEGQDLSDPCRDIAKALKTPVSKNFAAITNPRDLGGLLRAIDSYTGIGGVMKMSSTARPLRRADP